MNNLKIGVRLGLGFAVVLILLVVLTMTGVVRMEESSGLTHRLVNTSMNNQRLVAEWAQIIEVNGVRGEAAWRLADPEQQKRMEAAIAASSVRSLELQGLLEKSLLNASSQAQFKLVIVARAAYAEARKQLFAAKASGDMEQATKLYETEMEPKRVAYQAAVRKLSDVQQGNSDAVAQKVLATYAHTRVILLVLGAIALVAGVSLAYWITGSITVPIKAAVAVAETVASGDLTSSIVVDRRDETGQLMQALKNMNDNLVSIVGQVRGSTQTIATASAEIAAGNQDLSSRTEQQASSLEETASSMEQLTATVRQNADSARQANQLAGDAADIASRGGQVVAEVVTTMGSINDSSRKIVDIISVIDGIAFQTNILALNAAVEAARAGEQGRGFAVVATEVRNLAQRSAAAAKEIKGLIDDSVQKVEAGSSLVDKAGRTMDEIVQSIGFVTGIMNEITHASDEQRAGIEQVNQAITGMDQVTQQNAALVEQASAAAEAMQEQSAQLAQVVSVFRLHDAPGAPARTAPRRAATASISAASRAAPHPAAKARAKVALGQSGAPAEAVATPAAVAPRKETGAARPAAPAPAKAPARSASAKAGADEWEEF